MIAHFFVIWMYHIYLTSSPDTSVVSPSFAVIVNHSVMKSLVHELPLCLFSLEEIPRSAMTESWVVNILKALYTYRQIAFHKDLISSSSHQQHRDDTVPRASFLTVISCSGIPGIPFWACHSLVDLRTHIF